MAEEQVEEGRFVFGLRVLRNEDGSKSYHTKTLNEKVPIEVVIMQLKTFLKDLEEDYYKQFGKKDSD